MYIRRHLSSTILVAAHHRNVSQAFFFYTVLKAHIRYALLHVSEYRRSARVQMYLFAFSYISCIRCINGVLQLPIIDCPFMLFLSIQNVSEGVGIQPLKLPWALRWLFHTFLASSPDVYGD